jgi:uncharacterized membrane protein
VDAYTVVKYIHILLAIVAVGFNFSYAIWLTRAANAGDTELGFTLRGIKRLDDWFANPAYFLLGVTGITMWGLLGFVQIIWLEIALALLILALLVGLFGFTPTLRKQIALVEAGESNSAAYRGLTTRSNILGGILTLTVLVIIGLMVFKPTF